MRQGLYVRLVLLSVASTCMTVANIWVMLEAVCRPLDNRMVAIWAFAGLDARGYKDIMWAVYPIW